MTAIDVPTRLHVGVMVPSVNTVTEGELHDLAPDGVSIHLERIPVQQVDVSDDETTMTLLGEVRDGLRACVRRIASCDPDHIVLGMSAPVFHGGKEGSLAAVAGLQAECAPVVSAAAHGVVAALELLGKRRIAVLTPYQRVHDEQVERFFADYGFTITSLESTRSTTTHAIAETPDEEVVESLTRLAASGPDAIVQVGANLGMAHLVEEAESWLGLPVLALNVVGLWHALRSSGVTIRRDGYGTVWRDL